MVYVELTDGLNTHACYARPVSPPWPHRSMHNSVQAKSEALNITEQHY